MSDLTVNHVANNPQQFFCDLTSGKTRAIINRSKGSDPRFWVCCKNASHKVYRGLGRPFDTLDDALADYKSPRMKTIINAARDLWLEAVAHDSTLPKKA